MATQAENEQTLQQEITRLDPSADVEFGPIKDLFVTPTAKVLTDQDNIIDRLNLMYSTQFVSSMTSDELEALAYSYGLTRLPGTKATGTVTFIVSGIYSGSTVQIPEGTEVTTIDNVYAFLTTSDINMTQAELSTRYNATTRAYEIDVPIEAVDFGTMYQVAPYNINNINASLSIIARVENRVWTTGGSEIESDSDLSARLLQAIQSRDRSTVSGLEADVQAISTEIKDVQVVPQTYGIAAAKIYIIGGTLQTISESFVSQQVCTLTTVPVQSITQVKLNGTILNSSQYIFEEAYNTFTVTLIPTVTSGSIVEVTYTYNDLVNTVQTQYLDARTNLFATVIMSRQAAVVGMVVVCRIVLQAGIDKNLTEMTARSTILSTINTYKFVEYLYPLDVRRVVEQSVPGVASVVFTTFNRLDASNSELYSEVVEFAAGEYPLLDSNNLQIVIV